MSTNAIKTASTAQANVDKNTASPVRFTKSGSAWLYDQSSITYDGITDTTSGLEVFYDSLGEVLAPTNLPKHAA